MSLSSPSGPSVATAAAGVQQVDAAPRQERPRIASVDAYRGFVMLLMMAEVLQLRAVSRHLPESGFWRFLATIKVTRNGLAAACTI